VTPLTQTKQPHANQCNPKPKSPYPRSAVLMDIPSSSMPGLSCHADRLSSAASQNTDVNGSLPAKHPTLSTPLQHVLALSCKRHSHLSMPQAGTTPNGT
jgi:hypothetical protein